MKRRTFLAKLTTACAVVSTAALPIPAQAEKQIHKITIIRSAFHPETLPVRGGDRIRWTNNDIVPHTATALDQSWDTGPLAPGEAGEVIVGYGTQNTRFSGDYFCRYHPTMRGSIQHTKGPS